MDPQKATIPQIRRAIKDKGYGLIKCSFLINGCAAYEVFKLDDPSSEYYSMTVSELKERFALGILTPLAADTGDAPEGLNEEIDDSVTPLSAQELADISPRVREAVEYLRSCGFETCDSGDGSNATDGMACAIGERHVVVQCSPDDLVATTRDVAAATQREPFSDWNNVFVQGSWIPGEQGLVWVAESSAVANAKKELTE